MEQAYVANGFEPVIYEGVLVHSFVPINVSTGDTIRVAWQSTRSPLVQGLALRLRRPGVTGSKGYAGRLRIGDSVSPGKALWMDTAPAIVDIHCDAVPADTRLEFSNRWRAPNGREDEWLNNYGIRVEELGPDSWILHCSDGVGDRPTFDDLVVRIDIIRSNASAD